MYTHTVTSSSCSVKRKKNPGVMVKTGRVDFARAKPLQWRQFLHLVAVNYQENYLGLLDPNYKRCDPCTIKYDAVIKMETFTEDSRQV